MNINFSYIKKNTLHYCNIGSSFRDPLLRSEGEHWSSPSDQSGNLQVDGDPRYTGVKRTRDVYNTQESIPFLTGSGLTFNNAGGHPRALLRNKKIGG